MGSDGRGKFRIFISWSKSPSREVAQVVMDFLNTVLDGVHVWTSDSGILPGTRPMVSIHENLYEADAGLLLITRQNQDSPWINYEAGVLAQKVGDRENLVVPLLIDSQNSTDITGPLADLHNATFTEADMLKVVKALATASGSNESKVVTRFKLAWPGTKAKYEAIMTNHSITAKREDPAERSMDDKVDEILRRIRRLDPQPAEPNQPTVAKVVLDAAFAELTGGMEALLAGRAFLSLVQDGAGEPYIHVTVPADNLPESLAMARRMEHQYEGVRVVVVPDDAQS